MINSIFSMGLQEEERMDKYTAGLILGFLSAGLAIEAHANQVVEQAPLVYEYNLSGPTTLESEPVKTLGTIKTIYASYDFEGIVTLEVSANAGNSYTKIINGIPLAEGFMPGNELRFRANIAKGSVLKKLTLGFTNSSGEKRLFNNPDTAKFKYHKQIYISGSSEELFNYPVKINSQRDDIYFTAADGQTPLYYYQAKEEDDVWVKVPQIPTEGILIYVYYGYDGIAPANKYCDGSRVFLFFDDFSRQTSFTAGGIPQNAGSGLDEKKWKVVTGLKKEYNVEEENLKLKDCTVISRDFKMQQGILEYKAKAEENASIQAIVRGKDSLHNAFSLEQVVYSSSYPGAEHTIAINDLAKLNIGKPIQALTYYIYQVVVKPEGIIFERYANNYEKQAEIQFLDVGSLDQGYIGLKADTAPFNGGSVYFDWVRVRPYAQLEPVAQGPGLAKFKN